MLESNHDLEMLRTGPYPWAVKQRVMSRVGHLSNDSLAEFLAGDYDGGAAFLILAHLSEHNNHPDLARVAAEKALGARVARGLRLELARQDRPLAAITL
jgi:phosphoribosyl 1,2-cyclic phosphodiesterase